MKNILITGSNSYVGTSFKEYVREKKLQYKIICLSVRNNTWREEDFSKFDVILHCAGLVHQKRKIAESEYDRINHLLTKEIAKKAKREGVHQFIFMSSMSVYGIEEGIITENTIPKPTSLYGISKLKAEQELVRLDNKDFKVCILRPPMIYGYHCKGNYLYLSIFAQKTFIFPNIRNRRSMLYIENLNQFLDEIINEEKNGVYCPQNSEYVNTSEMVKQIAVCHGHKIWLINLLNSLCSVFLPKKLIRKIFGNLIYQDGEKISGVSFIESIRRSEKRV